MKIVLLCGKGDSSLFMYNGIKNQFKIQAIIQEQKFSSKKLLKRRIKKLGVLRVVNQVFFQVLIPRVLLFFSIRRIKEIKNNYNLNNEPFLKNILNFVPSVNSEECLRLICTIKPDIIIVNGTRIISKKILNATNALFINTHVGITPEYRGVHGAYWALRNNDIENCGVTIHKIDAGIDTGDIILQDIILITNKDNFVTYPFIQIGKAIMMMKKVLESVEKEELKTYKKTNFTFSKLWYHPTFTGYLYYRILKRVK